MSLLTSTLIGSTHVSHDATNWRRRFRAIERRLVAAYGLPRLGNFRDPVREVFYIVLSARTTDKQYRETERRLHAAFPTLAELAAGRIDRIRRCITSGGLANRRAAQVKRIAKRIISELGNKPAARLKAMSSNEAFEFLTSLPGVGPKSALCVMMYSLDHDVFPVDVNVHRIAERLGALPAGLKHYEAQAQLPAAIPSGASKALHIGLVVHGRQICKPLRQKCDVCFLRRFCDYPRRMRIPLKRKREQTADEAFRRWVERYSCSGSLRASRFTGDGLAFGVTR